MLFEMSLKDAVKTVKSDKSQNVSDLDLQQSRSHEFYYWGRVGGGDLGLMSWGTVDSRDSLDSYQSLNLMELMTRKWHPGLLLQTPPSPPSIQVPLRLMNQMDRMHLKSWPWGRLSIHSIHWLRARR